MTAQMPIDGKFTVTSPMGWRIHPVTGKRSHHNGVDLWKAADPTWIEAPYAGLVIDSGKSASSGNYVTLRHKIRGEYYTTNFKHMKDGSVKVRVGARIEAGTALGKMGATGLVTGRHLHWELRKGKRHTYSATGVGFIDPIPFFKALIAWEKTIATAPHPTPDPTPANPPAPAPNPAPEPKPKPAPVHTVKKGETLASIAPKYQTTWKALAALNRIENPNLIRVGQKLKTR